MDEFWSVQAYVTDSYGDSWWRTEQSMIKDAYSAEGYAESARQIHKRVRIRYHESRVVKEWK